MSTIPRFRVVEEEDGRLMVDVRGTLPNGAPFRRRMWPKVSTKKQAQTFAEGIWKGAVEGSTDWRESTITVERYAKAWLDKRTKRGLSSAVTNKYELERIMPLLGSVRMVRLTREQIADAVRELETNGVRRRGKGKLSPRSVRGSYTALHTLLADAVIDGLISTNPATLRAHRDEVPTVKDKDPLWRKGARYTGDELRQLVTDTRIPEQQRIAYALEGLAGLRYGEASALRWSAWDPDTEPLGRLSVHEAYDSNNDRLKGVKTDVNREVPVHAALARLLERWWSDGWKRAYGRSPRPDDLLVPVRDGRTLRHRHKLDGYKPHVKALALLGMPHRRQHDMRRTFITQCRTGGAQLDLLKWITHGAPRSTVIDEYTSPPWDVLCRQVECFSFDLRAVLGHSQTSPP